MEVQLSAENEAQLMRLAKLKGRKPNLIAKEILADYLEAEAKFVEAVKIGKDAIKAGKYLTHAEVGKRISRMIES